VDIVDVAALSSVEHELSETITKLRALRAVRVQLQRPLVEWLGRLGYFKPLMRSVASHALHPGRREIIRLRDGSACRWCGSRDRIEVHHVIPWTWGGRDDSWNLVTLCFTCHRREAPFSAKAATYLASIEVPRCG
jgi:hypothetical protein